MGGGLLGTKGNFEAKLAILLLSAKRRREYLFLRGTLLLLASFPWVILVCRLPTPPLLSQPNLRAISGILHKEKCLPLKFGLGLGCLDLESNSENLLGIALRVGRGLEGKEM